MSTSCFLERQQSHQWCGFLHNLLAWNVDYLSECQVVISTFGTSDLDPIVSTKCFSFSPKSERLIKSALGKHCCIFSFVYFGSSDEKILFFNIIKTIIYTI